MLAAWRKARRLPGYKAARQKIPRRPQARSLGQSAAALGPGAGAGGRARALGRAALRPFPAHAVLGDALRRHHARAAVERLGARQGHLDQRGLGRDGKARRLFLAGDLHGRRPAAAQAAGAAARTAEARLSRPRLRPSAAAARAAAAARRLERRRSRHHPVDRPQGREEGIRRSSGRARQAAARRSTGASSMSAPASFPIP